MRASRRRRHARRCACRPAKHKSSAPCQCRPNSLRGRRASASPQPHGSNWLCFESGRDPRWCKKMRHRHRRPDPHRVLDRLHDRVPYHCLLDRHGHGRGPGPGRRSHGLHRHGPCHRGRGLGLGHLGHHSRHDRDRGPCHRSFARRGRGHSRGRDRSRGHVAVASNNHGHVKEANSRHGPARHGRSLDHGLRTGRDHRRDRGSRCGRGRGRGLAHDRGSGRGRGPGLRRDPGPLGHVPNLDLHLGLDHPCHGHHLHHELRPNPGRGRHHNLVEARRSLHPSP
mmetsp:Transcript_124425/g.323309  ORF Transcript_124425/g.323309 Transcript_124425/m.323309 type:complete len:282 (-) Transcript_124425:1347-2192(-)